MSNTEINKTDKYYLESTGDRTDRTAEIEKKLCECGVCLLGAGVFYVNGVKMPDETTLMGMGTATKLVLAPEIEAGFTVQIGSFSCIKNLYICGTEEERTELGETVGERHGILFKGTATTKDWSNQPKHSIIEACEIRSFTGGGLTCVDTGYSIRCALTASNCHIFNCGAGINIPHFSEYHEFTNILCCENIYGCINNGGNNVFVNCGFNANVTGYLIDNSADQSCNNSHGAVVGLTFNHNGNNKGIGIQLLGATNGYVFSGCQVFYSKIIVEDSTCITFNAFNFGRHQTIEVKGGKLVMFTNCAFHGEPTITVSENEATKFVNCYLKDGTPITA